VFEAGGHLYHHAVEWCLYEQSSQKGDEKWGREFAENVVVPLWQCLKFFAGNQMSGPGEGGG
jgi:hypothetical protein